MVKPAAPVTERTHLQSSQDRKVTPVAWFQDKKQRWVPSVQNSFSLPPIDSCPGRTEICSAACYAVKFSGYAGVDAAQRQNFLLLLKAEATGGEEAVYRLLHELIVKLRRQLVRKKVPSKDWLYRLHEAGDFYSLTYALAWQRVIRENPDIKFLIYTRSFLPDCNVLPALIGLANASLYISADAENIDQAHQAAAEYNLSLAPFGKNAEHGLELYNSHERPDRRAIVCPENTGRLALIGPSRKNPQNGQGACMSCRACFKGRFDIIFIDEKGPPADQPVLFTVKPSQVPPTSKPVRICAYRNCNKVVTGNGNRLFCDDDCRIAEYQYRRRGDVEPKPTAIATPLLEVPVPRGKPKISYSDDQLLEHLRMLTKELKRKPTEIDLLMWRRNHDDVGPSISQFTRAFGSITQARLAAHVDVILEELKEST